MMTKPHVIQLELFTNRFRAIVQEMGEMLQRTAISTNVKERLDFSCALLDGDGDLVVNAPHLPVHLGAMGVCVRSVREVLSMEPGDVIVTNHPAFGGSHLPDITVITAVFFENKTLLGYVANRAHHAEIGGVRPGSMPPHATRLAEEGVVITPFHLFKSGKANWDALRDLLTKAPFPTRAIEDNLADLRAAVAANHRGVTALVKLAETSSVESVQLFMRELKRLAEQKIRAAIAALPDGVYSATEFLDDGSPLSVKIEIRGDEATVDFSGSADVHRGNLNATPAIVRSVVIYVLRLLINEPLPLNEGLMKPIAVKIPKGMLNPHFPDNPVEAPAVVGGNVETSQRLVDTLLKALKLSACSQGTMNNTLFGTETFGYYETVCGGCGAGPNFHGADAVHSHMTNTRITDPEILEHRYPVRLERFEIRRRSGGAGKFRGGDGVIRELTFLAKMDLSIVSQHRAEGPFGAEGGDPGKPGRQQVIRANGEIVGLNGIDGCTVFPGDRLILETPGGGGFGKAG
jgi:5-oxoprolinase (ATP-hydrolysing)